MKTLQTGKLSEGVIILGESHYDGATDFLEGVDGDVLIDLETAYWATAEGLKNIASFLQDEFKTSSLTVFTSLRNLVHIWQRKDFPLFVSSTKKVRAGIYCVVLELRTPTMVPPRKKKSLLAV